MSPRADIEAALRGAVDRLREAGCESPRLDAEILLAEALGVSRAYLHARPEKGLPLEARDEFADWVGRRAQREPLAYIVGHREFYGLEFMITPAVLVPRPETEHVVEKVLTLARARSEDEGVRIADVGTGSGAIAVAVVVHLPRAQAWALDSSGEALDVARVNAERHGVADRVHCIQSDLLAALPQPVDIVAANLPYISDAEWDGLAPEIRLYEPEMALRGGADGLEVVRALIRQAPGHLLPGGALVLEIGAEQGQAVQEFAQRILPGATTRLVQDYAGLDRVVVVRLP